MTEMYRFENSEKALLYLLHGVQTKALVDAAYHQILDDLHKLNDLQTDLKSLQEQIKSVKADNQIYFDSVPEEELKSKRTSSKKTK